MEFLSHEQKQRILTEVIEKFLVPHFMKLGMNATGNWVSRVEAVGDVIRGPKYSEQLVWGRSPGKFAPIAPLVEWAKAKFGLDEKAATSMAYGVSHNLQKFGSSWYRQGGSSLIEVLKSQEVTDYITSRVGNFITQQVTLELQRSLKNAFK